MKKNYLYIFLIFLVVSCGSDTAQKKVKESFNQLINSLKVENSQEIDTLMPFLKDRKEEERTAFLVPFRKLINTEYKLNISKESNELYYVKVIPKDSNTVWSGVLLPFQLNKNSKWVMAPTIKVIQTYDIVPAKD